MGYAHRVEGGRQVQLKEFDPAEDTGLKRKEAAHQTAQLLHQVLELQELLYAVRQQSVLIILQGRDTSGKDGTIRQVAGQLNAQSCTVTAFQAPTAAERAHDFLWRVHAQTPPAGYIKIFNRSHYEDVLVGRVHGHVPEAVWRPRYGHINAFERLLADSGTILLKFYLHISPAEQKQRLLAREHKPIKAWKLSLADWQERAYWEDYTTAYEDMLTCCSTPQAPWFIVPADKKWFRNLAVVETLRDALLPFREQWLAQLEKVGRENSKAIEAYRRSRNYSG
jgi:PPK2 family polyphosphate:nucleotide phosphotransferase